NLGNALAAEGRLDDAVKAYELAITLSPRYAEAHNNLGGAFTDQGKLDKAATCYERAIVLGPDYAEAHYNLGKVLQLQCRFDEAKRRYEQALSLQPNHIEARNNLGNVLRLQGQFDEAAACFKRALETSPDNIDVLANLGAVLLEQGRSDEAWTAYERVLALAPDNADAIRMLGMRLALQARLEEALAHFERALEIDPDNKLARSDYLMCLNYTDRTAAEIFNAHRRFGEVHERDLPPPAPHLNDRNPKRRLRVGYVSGDFCNHSVAWFLAPLLTAHDPAAVEVFCYAEVVQPDAVTERLKGQADHWVSTVGMSDQALAERIRAERIDILVDLAGHTAHNRLTMFALKPAPVQITWLGYPNTTGLSAMDWRLVDAVTDPPGEADGFATESLVRLEDGFLCYGPPPDAPEPAPPPCLAAGVVTFGSFNNPSKLGDATLDVWAKLLERLPAARLLLKGGAFSDEAARQRFHARFEQRGVAPERVVLKGYAAHTADHLALYADIDIGLDPFPYNGTTTTCEALWMGVPVVALLGGRHAGRVSASLLTRVGLEELIARDAQAYVDIAARLAGDPARLAELRATLRPRMAASPLTDAPAFARKLERAYRQMWTRWCDGGEVEGP
ncbi:MAG: tetratricopeptide repeat protein, partial [Caulobacterales bacterium]